MMSGSTVPAAQTKLTNTEVLCFVLGWQGGTLTDVAQALAVRAESILSADGEAMATLCRKAQVWRRFHSGKDENELTRLVRENERLIADNERLRKALKSKGAADPKQFDRGKE